MQLSRRDVRELRRRLADSQKEALRLAVERREGERRQVVFVPVEVRSIGAGRRCDDVPCRLRDASREGLSLASRVPLPIDERLRLTIPREGGDVIELLCTVRWCHHDQVAGCYAVGCDAGVSWNDSLCDLVLPPDTPIRRAA
jgi:hypothetical protein